MLALLVSLACTPEPAAPADTVPGGLPEWSNDPADVCTCGGTDTFAAPEDDGWLFTVGDAGLDDWRVTLPQASVDALTGDLDLADTIKDRVVCGVVETPHGTLYDVGVKLKGKPYNSYQPVGAKPYLHLDFDLCGEREVSGLRSVRLYNQWQDVSQVQRYLGYTMWERAGYPAVPRAGFAHVWFNDVDLGLYGVNETIEAPFFDGRTAAFQESVGNLYEGEYGLDFTAGKVEGFEVVQAHTASREDLYAIAEVVDADAAFAQGIGPLDLERWYLHWALEVAVSAREGYTFITNNFYVYTDPGTGETTMVPWGFDQVLYDLSVMPDAAGGLIPGRGMDQPEFLAGQCDALRGVVEDAALWEGLAVEKERVEAAIAAEGITTFEPFTAEEVALMRRSVSYYLEARPEQLQAWIAASCP